MTNADNYYMGEEYYYEIINNYDIEIRFFIFDLDENIDKQMQFIENHDVNGLSVTAHEQDIFSSRLHPSSVPLSPHP